MYSSFDQFLTKVKATSTGKLLDSLPRNDVVAELCSGKFNMAYCHDPECKNYQIPPSWFNMIIEIARFDSNVNSVMFKIHNV
jgi:hypothetical protein